MAALRGTEGGANRAVSMRRSGPESMVGTSEDPSEPECEMCIKEEMCEAESIAAAPVLERDHLQMEEEEVAARDTPGSKRLMQKTSTGFSIKPVAGVQETADCNQLRIISVVSRGSASQRKGCSQKPTSAAQDSGSSSSQPDGFTCNSCQKTFLSKYVLLTHVFVHIDAVGPPLNICRLCADIFPTQRCLQMHYLQIHLQKQCIAARKEHGLPEANKKAFKHHKLQSTQCAEERRQKSISPRLQGGSLRQKQCIPTRKEPGLPDAKKKTRKHKQLESIQCAENAEERRQKIILPRLRGGSFRQNQCIATTKEHGLPDAKKKARNHNKLESIQCAGNAEERRQKIILPRLRGGSFRQKQCIATRKEHALPDAKKKARKYHKLRGIQCAEDTEDRRQKNKSPRLRGGSFQQTVKDFSRLEASDCDSFQTSISKSSNLPKRNYSQVGEAPNAGHENNTSVKLEQQVVDHPHECNDCGRHFKHRNHLLQHAVSHQKKQLMCDHCERTFKRPFDLRLHTFSHTGEKPHVCKCGKSFAKSCSLKRHEMVHRGEKPYTCKVCFKSFTDASVLRSHGVVHSGERPYVCAECDKAFKEQGHLKRHLLQHTGEKPFKCRTCGMSFTQSASLTRHTRVHTGEKPYKCDVCSKAFADNSNFRVHMLAHHGKKSLKCDVCEKRFLRRGDLVDHVRLHIL